MSFNVADAHCNVNIHNCLDSGSSGRHVLCDTSVGIAVHDTLAKIDSTSWSKKAVPGLQKSWKLAWVCFFSHVFCNHIPHAESVIWHFSKRSVEEVLRPHSNTILQNTFFFQKKTFLFLFLAFGGHLYWTEADGPRFGARLGGAFLHRATCKFICKNLRNLAH